MKFTSDLCRCGHPRRDHEDGETHGDGDGPCALCAGAAAAAKHGLGDKTMECPSFLGAEPEPKICVARRLRRPQDVGFEPFTYPTDTPGRWFGPGWNFRVYQPGKTGERLELRVLAWKLKDRHDGDGNRGGNRGWNAIDSDQLEEGDVWLPLPGNPFYRRKAQ